MRLDRLSSQAKQAGLTTKRRVVYRSALPEASAGPARSGGLRPPASAEATASRV